MSAVLDKAEIVIWTALTVIGALSAVGLTIATIVTGYMPFVAGAVLEAGLALMGVYIVRAYRKIA